MSRILIGWELGANRGHVVRIAALARALVAAGHEVAAALQRIDGAAGELPAGTLLWQAPLWPRLLVNVARTAARPPATMGDILVNLGLDRAETLAALVAGWDSILAAVRPDVVVTDFAPALLCAARGRVPTIASGTGFERVPAGLERFPSLTGQPAVHDETAALERANAGLRAAGRAPLDRLPALFAADASLAGEFTELDPYAAARADPLVAPSLKSPLPPEASGAGEELFVYGFEMLRPDAQLWQGLAASGLPVRAHVPNAPRALAEGVAALGITFEPEPLPWREIGERSRLLVSHGGHGFVCSGLIAGLPQLVTHYDLEKRGNGEGVTRAGLGAGQSLFALKAEPFAAALRALYANDALAARARAAAPSFRARSAPGHVEEVMAAVGRLLD